MEIRDGKYPLSHLVHFPARVKLLPVIHAWRLLGPSLHRSVLGDMQAPDFRIFLLPLKFGGENRNQSKCFYFSLRGLEEVWVGWMNVFRGLPVVWEPCLTMVAIFFMSGALSKSTPVPNKLTHCVVESHRSQDFLFLL